jgi:hypothetical protein
MSHERTVAQFVAEIEHLTGRRILIRWMPVTGLYLEDVETGNTFVLGEGSKWRILSSAHQERICRGLQMPEIMDLLGLNWPHGE